MVWLTDYRTEYTMVIMGQKAVYEVRQDLYRHLQTMSQDFYDQSASGRIISRLTNDIDRMSELLSGGLISTFAQIFIVFAIGIKQKMKYAHTLGIIWGLMLVTDAIIQGGYELIILKWSNACLQTYVFLVLGLIPLISLLITRRAFIQSAK